MLDLQPAPSNIPALRTLENIGTASPSMGKKAKARHTWRICLLSNCLNNYNDEIPHCPSLHLAQCCKCIEPKPVGFSWSLSLTVLIPSPVTWFMVALLQGQKPVRGRCCGAHPDPLCQLDPHIPQLLRVMAASMGHRCVCLGELPLPNQNVVCPTLLTQEQPEPMNACVTVQMLAATLPQDKTPPYCPLSSRFFFCCPQEVRPRLD